MASSRLKSVFGACIAGSLMFGSTAALASTPAAPQQLDPWAVLAAMSGGAPAAAICGSAAGAAAAAQAPATGCVLPVVDVPPPPPPVAAAAPPPPLPLAAESAGISPLLLGLFAVAAGVGAYLALHGHHHANSPA